MFVCVCVCACVCVGLCVFASIKSEQALHLCKSPHSEVYLSLFINTNFHVQEVCECFLKSCCVCAPSLNHHHAHVYFSEHIETYMNGSCYICKYLLSDTDGLELAYLLGI